ncbi:MAG: MarR family EPS-associated transcriptional regulator [Gammaproteobacteria bacterium]
MNDETHYRLLKLIEAQPEMSQRELAEAMGVSLGKINYCLRAAIERGWIKAKNFTKSRNKRAYAYYLTPKGAEEKAKVTTRFLKHKIMEYKEIKEEIKRLKREAATGKASSEAGIGS